MTQKHFTATGFVFDSENDKILMILHKKLGVWLPPGGHVEPNEPPHETVLREIYEETGVKAEIVYEDILGLDEPFATESPAPFLVLSEDIDGDGSHFHIDLLYLCRAVEGKLTAQEDEVDGAEWFALEELRDKKTFRNVLKSAERAAELWKKSNAGKKGAGSFEISFRKDKINKGSR